MLNGDPDDDENTMVFYPAVIHICPGDTIQWKKIDDGHNTTILVCAKRCKKWVGEVDEEVKMTFNVEGTYIYNCEPHLSGAMIGFIMVGKPTDKKVIEKQMKLLAEEIYMNEERPGEYMKLIKYKKSQ